MKKVIAVRKNIGETPLEVIGKIREKYPDYVGEKMSYAGRLDPMADGVLLILIGEENKKREKYLALDKEYECDFVFGVETDSFDVLGLVNKVVKDPDVNTSHIRETLLQYKGSHILPYPPFSSKTVAGKPLFELTRAGQTPTLPEREMAILDIEIIKNSNIYGQELAKQAISRVEKVHGDFRQSAITQKWHGIQSKFEEVLFPVVTVRIVCKSGTYMRTIVHEVGRKLGVGGCALRISRTRLGEFLIKDALRLSP